MGILKLHKGAAKQKGPEVNFGGTAKPQYLLELFSDSSVMGIGRWQCGPGSWEEDQMFDEVLLMMDGDLTVKDRETGEEITAHAGDAVLVKNIKIKWTTKKGCTMWFISYPSWKTGPSAVPQYKGEVKR